tara:strand:- start:25 stop:441 length:417 start_codon:yes stop_codon:yes gene_type:complete
MRTLLIILFLIFLPNNLMAKTPYYKDGVKLFKKNKLDEAKFKFEQDIVHNPKNELSYLYLSKIFNEQENKPLEEKNLNTVILLNPKNEEAVYNLAILKLGKSDFLESKKLVNNLLIFCENYCQKTEKLKIKIEESLKK